MKSYSNLGYPIELDVLVLPPYVGDEPGTKISICSPSFPVKTSLVLKGDDQQLVRLADLVYESLPDVDNFPECWLVTATELENLAAYIRARAKSRVHA